jgi:murein DD-endopeptidase MepM/ murein hydrolase activator NlpD
MKWRGLLALLLLLLSVPASAQDTSVTIHVVQRGETLFRIAQRYGVSVNELARLNSINNPGNILVGQRLLVPSDENPLPQTHIVQPGETLATISALYGLTQEQLASLNSLTDPNQIYIGQALVVAASSAPTAVANLPVEAAPSPAEPAASPLIHVIQRGETLFRIAQQYGVSMNDLAQANSITNPEFIYAGQQLIIPGVEAPQLMADLPAPVTGLEATPIVLVEGQAGRFRMTTSSPVSVRGTFLNQSLIAAAEVDGTRLTILMGVPVGTTPGVYPLSLTVTDAAGVQTPINVNMQVVGGGYYREFLSVARTDLLDPGADEAELNVLRSVMSAFNPERYFDGLLGLPAAAPITSRFGVLRSYNGGMLERLHAGTDFAGAPGTPILAPAAGRVVLAQALDIRGNATIIDHGWGVYSGYWHQSAQYVQVGDFVSAGQVIGAVGSTGRVTGAHLHWEIWVNGIPVDPMQWVRVSFS